MFVIFSTPQISFLSNYYFLDLATCTAFIESLRPYFKNHVFRVVRPSLVSKSKKVNTYSAALSRVVDSLSPVLFNS